MVLFLDRNIDWLYKILSWDSEIKIKMHIAIICINCLQKGPLIKYRVPSMVLCRGCGNFKVIEKGRSLGQWRNVLKGNRGVVTTSSLSYAFSHEMKGLLCYILLVKCITPPPRLKRKVNNQSTEISKSVSHNQPHLFVSGFRKLTQKIVSKN